MRKGKYFNKKNEKLRNERTNNNKKKTYKTARVRLRSKIENKKNVLKTDSKRMSLFKWL